MSKSFARKLLFLILILLLMVLVSGCWSRKEIEQATFIGSVAIDKSENDSKLLEVTVEFIIPQAVGQRSEMMSGMTGTGSKYWLISSTGMTIDEAFSKMRPLVPYHFYFGHLNSIIISEKVAQEGIKEILDTFDRTFILRRSIWLMVSPGKAKDIFYTHSRLQEIPSIAIGDLFYLQSVSTVTYPSNLNRVLIALSSRSTNPLIARIEPVINKNEEQIKSSAERVTRGDIELAGSAMFKNDKFVDWLDVKETRGVLWVQNKTRNGSVTLPNPGGNHKLITFDILGGSRTRMHTVMKDNKLFIDLRIFFDANLNEQTSNADILSTDLEYQKENVQGYTDALAAEVRQSIMSAVKKAQLYKTDVFGIGERFYIEHPQEFKKLQANWEDVFSKAEFNIRIECHIRRTGLLNRSINAQQPNNRTE